MRFKRNSILLTVIAALLAGACHCAFLPVSHACCEPGQEYDACCQRPQALTPVLAPVSDPVPLAILVGPPAWQAVVPDWLGRIALEAVSLQSLAFIPDVSKRRCDEFCVLLN